MTNRRTFINQAGKWTAAASLLPVIDIFRTDDVMAATKKTEPLSHLKVVEDEVDWAEKPPIEVIRMMASKEARIHHFLWHQTRNSWNKYPTDIKTKLTALGWEPPRVYRKADDEVIFGNHAGEDFLYMHRMMVKKVNAKLQEVTGDANAKIKGWTSLPEPGDAKYPVPKVYEHATLPFLNQVVFETKSDEYYEKKLLFWEKTMKDPNFLANISLGDLGCLIESTIHDAMHMRWSTAPKEFRPDDFCSPTSDPNSICNIDAKWNDISYDFLADEYSAHVNPIFWKIHGWVDDRISDWLIVNKINVGFHTVMVEPNWIGKWVGPVMHHPFSEATNGGGHDHGHDQDHFKDMAVAASHIFRSKIIHHCYSIKQNKQ